jgi:hypothetical protein
MIDFFHSKIHEVCKMKKLLLLLCFVAWCGADTHTAASAEYAACSTAVFLAASGDTIIVPADTVTWSKSLTMRVGVVISGAGIDKTIITGTGQMFQYQPNTPASNELFHIKKFTIDGNNVSNTTGIYVANTSTTAILKNILIDSCKIENTKATAIYIQGSIYGLICKNIIRKNSLTFRFLGNNDYSWSDALHHGTADFIYVEDNTIDSNYIMTDCGWGTRYVFRHNTFNMGSTDITAIDAHGNLHNDGSPTGLRGCVGVEIYENTFTNCNRGSINLYDQRGGSGIVFNNSATGSTSGCNLIIVVREEDDNSAGDMGSQYYPVKTSHPGYDPVEKTYLWNNTLNSSPMCFVNYDPDVMIIDKQDVWTDVKSWGAGSNSYFTNGTHANRPGTPSDNDCYWETDTKQLYRSVGVNNWQLVYKPYDYPYRFSNENASCHITIPSICLGAKLCTAQTINISGIVKDTAGVGIYGAAVKLEKAGISTTTGADGSFTLKKGPAEIQPKLNNRKLTGSPIRLQNGNITISVVENTPVAISIYDISGRQIYSDKKKYSSGTHAIHTPLQCVGLFLYRLTIGNVAYSFKSLSFGTFSTERTTVSSGTFILDNQANATSVIADVISVVKEGQLNYRGSIKTSDTSGVVVKMIPNAGNVTDADGNVYQRVRIGNQVWTVENLKTTKYNDGTNIPYSGSLQPGSDSWSECADQK